VRGLQATACAVALGLGGVAAAAADAPDITGAWRAETYELSTGQHYPVEGLITFTATDWTVVYFVMPEGAGAQRGEGGGGTYTLEDDRLTFTHLFHMSAGSELPGLPASDLRMVARRDPSSAPAEAARVDRTGDRLTIYFPSGNTLVFRMSSGPAGR